jgi:sterol desaturase/sphingolipid hydroxylase (fatty acid hydroxylase superfamily)
MLESPYMSFFLGFLTALCGVPLEMIVIISTIDVIWGSMLHASPLVISRRYGPLEYFMQTPSYHRAHHAQNPRYMDTNYNSITLFWDWVMGTLQPLKDEEPVVYGITRDVDVESWRDVQFGEVKLLWDDVKTAPGLKNKICYLVKPPGWSHTGDHKMATTVKRALITTGIV